MLPDGADGSFRIRVRRFGRDDGCTAPAGLGPAREGWSRLGLMRRICPKVETSVSRRGGLFGGEVPIGEGENVTPAVRVVVVVACCRVISGEGFGAGEDGVGPMGICSGGNCGDGARRDGDGCWESRDWWHLEDEGRVVLVLCPTVTSESSR